MSFSPLASPGATRAVLEAHGLATKHRLGQNFLVNDHVIGRILDLAEPSPDDLVFEVGPGIGTLTCALLPRAGAVVAVEADRSLAPVLRATCAAWRDSFALVLGDALRVGADDLRRAAASLGLAGVPTDPTMLVANLPYQVAATVILDTLQQMPSVGRCVCMVQKEVADRISAVPGTKAYGAYTVKLGLYAEVTGRFEVGPANFMPPPHVDSSVVRLDRVRPCDPATGEPLTDAQRALCAGVVDAAFAQRRKTIRNSMGARGFDKDAVDAALAAVGIPGTRRAETLSVADVVGRARALAEAS